ncbi:MAG: rhomboid family intramembrane serine protease [Bacteroidales bacterium]|nr:rhomboid family intramembrane serine protease [Bacteroidales bacterium]
MSYYSNGRQGFLANTPRITRNLIIINIIIFVATFLAERVLHNDVFGRMFALYPLGTPYFRFWQPVTYMFMHGGIWHILFNMYTLYIFGSVVERMIGERKYLLFYFICGLGAAALQLGVQSLQNTFACTVGASGAIYGLLIAYAMLFPESKLTLIFPPVTMSAKWMVVVFVVIELLTSVGPLDDGVAHLAHLGGMLFGWLLIKYWKSKGTLFNREDL